MGSGDNMAKFSPSRKDDQAYRIWWARRERAAASPATAIALMQMNSQIDISGILSSVRVPTLVIHRTHDGVVNVDGGRQLARLIPNAQFFESPGTDHTPWTGDDIDAIAERVEEFLTGSRLPASIDRVLATVLFTDIVASTERCNRSVIAGGKRCSMSTTTSSGGNSAGFAATRCGAWVTASWRPSKVRPARCIAP
jgi:hypothetical protein